jgi:transposase
VSGRKRHILVDTEGLLLKVRVHPANIQDRDGARLLLTLLNVVFPRLAMLWADAGYQGRCADWIRILLGWTVEIVRKAPKRIWWPVDQEPPALPTGFQVLKRRWVVERTFAWLSKCRGLLVRYDKKDGNYLGLIQLACGLLWYRRLHRMGRCDVIHDNI